MARSRSRYRGRPERRVLEPDRVIVTTSDPRLWFNGPSGMLFLDGAVADPPTLLLAAADALRQISAPAELYYYAEGGSFAIGRLTMSPLRVHFPA